MWLTQREHLGTEQLYVLWQMRRHEQRPPAKMPQDEVRRQPMGVGVERGEGLIQEHGLRAICQGTCELNTASLASRELPDRQVEQALGQKLDQKGPSLAAIDRSPRDKERVVDGVEPP